MEMVGLFIDAEDHRLAQSLLSGRCLLVSTSIAIVLY